MDFRIGNGIDFHRLIIDSNRPLILGGAIIDSEFALEGHSDGDIILHAAADAILGAVAGPDIGELFPDTDMKWKGLDSAQIIKSALFYIEERQFQISNVDITIIGERPKIKPHKTAIRQSISNHLKIDLSRIGLKATTTEKMGFVGREEGIGCFATALLFKN
ncbi:MAG: 2-C-methyl-D-erythritol 2,4-cyclodiphosphate synthase [Leptonema sp. (in: Bacteria)]|nr:2-C-methyl-D-erythritol 2,4-cyclodiphosphate synthase [Leptonema sp. (in: bacteria)]